MLVQPNLLVCWITRPIAERIRHGCLHQPVLEHDPTRQVQRCAKSRRRLLPNRVRHFINLGLIGYSTACADGVRHAGRDLGRSGNPLVGLVPVFALATLVSAIIAARRKAKPVLPKLAGATAAGALSGLVIY